MGEKQQFHARILHLEENRWWAMVDHRKISFTPDSHQTVSAGDIVLLSGVQTNCSPWKVDDVSVLQKYAGEETFPPLHSDWHRFHSEGGPSFDVARRMSQVKALIRTFFTKQNFIEVDTPSVGMSPGLEVHLEAMEVNTRPGPDLPFEKRWLMTSPEYHMKRLLSADFDAIFQMGKAFRSGEVGPFHNPEFLMLEWYRAFAPWSSGPEDTRLLVQELTRAVCDSDEMPGWEEPIDVSGNWKHLTVREAIIQWAGFDPEPWNDGERIKRKAEESGIRFSSQETNTADYVVRLLVEKVEPNLPKNRPFVLTHYPECTASLARRSAEIPGTAERFEIYLGGIELANGFGELTDWKEQLSRFEDDLSERKRMDMPVYPIDERFIDSMKTGIPPSMGIALGVDRLALGLLGLSSLSQLLLFPVPRN